MCEGGEPADDGIQRREFLAHSAVGAAMVFGSGASPAPAGAAEETMNRTSFRERLLQCLGGPWPDPADLRPSVEAQNSLTHAG